MRRLPLSLTVGTLLLSLGCGGQSQPMDVEDDGPEPTGPLGRVWALIGYPPIVNESLPDGAVYGAHPATIQVGSEIPIGRFPMDLGFIASQTGFAPCFPEALVLGEVVISEEGVSGEANYTFGAMGGDGTTSVEYVLALQGGSQSGAWPVPVGTSSAFDANSWTLTSTGNGCAGTGAFPDPVRVEVRHLSQTTVNPGSTPFLRAPFEGMRELSSWFDHNGGVGGIVNFQGATFGGQENHAAYDWAMPEGTELFAVADGVVVWSDVQPPVYCSGLDQIKDDGLWVGIEHVADDGQRFMSQYIHLARADVELGEAVTTGDVIGLSGNTGCSSFPHLHFSVHPRNPDGVDFWSRYRSKVDPYGWHGVGEDPWAADLRGALNQVLWLPGEAPCVGISPTNFSLNGSGEGEKSFDVPFRFSFYGSEYNTVFLNADGGMTFGNGSVTVDPGAADVTDPGIAVFWGNLDDGLQLTNTYLYQTCFDRFVVQFQGARDHDVATRSNTATVTLLASGKITIEYSAVQSADILVGVFDGTHSDDRYLAVQDSYASYSSTGSGIILFDAGGPGPIHTGELTNRTIVFEP